MKKEPQKFHDENGEECCPASLVESALMVIGSMAGVIVLIGVIWLSKCFAHFLNTVPQ